jgi:transposase
LAWTEITRARYRRDGQRYASDLTNAEWRLIEPLLPARRRWGRPRVVDLRAVVDGLLYILATGCQWRALPRDFPPCSRVQGYFYRWRDDRVWQRIVDQLVTLARTMSGRSGSPSVGIIDSQSVATTQSGGPRGLDPAKRIKAASVISSPIPRAIFWRCMSILLMCRIVTAPCRCSQCCVSAFPSFSISWPIGSIGGISYSAPSRHKAPGPLKSSSDLSASKASSSCRGDGSSNGPSHGSGDAGASLKTSKEPSTAPSHGSSSLTSDYSPGDSLAQPILFESDSEVANGLV